MRDVMSLLEETVRARAAEPQEGSYTCYLLEKGLDKVLKKLGEECAETIIAAKNGEAPLLVGETADLLYHLAVMLHVCGVPWDAVHAELMARAEKIGNLKAMRNTDHNS